MPCLLKKLLPFALTLVVGLTIGTFTHFFRPTSNHSIPTQVDISQPLLINGLPYCFSDVESQSWASSLIAGDGSAHHEVIRIAFSRQNSEVEEQYFGARKIISRENKLRDAKILYLPPPDYWTEEHDFKHCDYVKLSATLDPSGEIIDIASLPLTESIEHINSAIAAARKIRFEPAVDEYDRKMSQKVAIVY